MSQHKTYNIILAETAPILIGGFIRCIKNINEMKSKMMEVDTKKSLFEILANENIDLLIMNPSFGGLLHPDDLRKGSRNPDIKIFAIEIGKLSPETLSLYDDHIHVTDDQAEITSKVTKAINPEKEKYDEKESLSSREKEIIVHVVKGLTNQEIADKLYLSVHTVMTHRRNIARKLQIHSATGLTIYAIVNKLVDLSEIKVF